MDEKKKLQCPLQAECMGQECAWYCIFDRGGAKEAPQGCAVRFLAYELKAFSIKTKQRIGH